MCKNNLASLLRHEGVKRYKFKQLITPRLNESFFYIGKNLELLYYLRAQKKRVIEEFSRVERKGA